MPRRRVPRLCYWRLVSGVDQYLGCRNDYYYYITVTVDVAAGAAAAATIQYLYR